MSSDKVTPDTVARGVEVLGIVDDAQLHSRDPPGHDPFNALNDQSPSRKLLIYTLLCFAIFLDTVNNSALFSAIPVISSQLDIPDSQSVWLLSAYQLTFAALLLVSGRVSDLYNPKWVFVTGAGTMGVFALVAGFIRSQIPLIIFRALMGSGGSLTIPAAMHLIVHIYTEPSVQAKAIAAFSGMGAVGIVLGLIIGALFVSYTSWPWVFYFSAIISFLITAAVVILVPNIKRSGEEVESRADRILRFRRLDLIGVLMFAVALILFIFAMTSGSISGWGSARVISTLVISAVLLAAFFIWEAWLPEAYAALPPKMWRYPNFGILIVISLLPFLWWSSVFLLFAWYWELVYDWSAIDAAAHFLPVGLGMFPMLPLAAGLQSKLRLKWVIFIGFALLLAGSILLPFADSKAHYWRYALPGFLLGTMGAACIFATTNVALFAWTPPEVSGIVAALFNCVLQTGSAAGVAIVTSIQTSVQSSHGGPNGFAGRAAGFWFIVAATGTMALLFLVFMKDIDGPPQREAVAPSADRQKHSQA